MSVTELEATIALQWAQLDSVKVFLQHHKLIGDDRELFEQTLYEMFKLGYAIGLTEYVDTCNQR